MSAPLLSIVVPTRERADTLIETLELLADIGDIDHEVIVVDNASEDITPQVVASRHNPRIRYLRAPQRLPMPQNFALGLSHAVGRYVMTLGDDDMVIPSNLRRALDRAETTDCDLIYWHRAFFYWGNYVNTDLAGYFGIPIGRGDHAVDPRHLLNTALRGRISYEYLPNIYNGLVRRSFLERYRRSISGAWFPPASISMDVCSALLFCTLDPATRFLESPGSVSGISRHSNGMSVHHDRTESQRFASELGYDDVSQMMPSSYRGVVAARTPRGVARMVVLADYEATLRDYLVHRLPYLDDPEALARLWLRRLVEEGDVEVRPDSALALALARDGAELAFPREDKETYFFDFWSIPRPQLHSARFDGRDATVRHMLEHLKSIRFNEQD